MAHRPEDQFPGVEAFDPGREHPQNPYSYIPFGGGRRKCVGNAFALLQVKVIFMTLLRQHEFELAGPSGTFAEIMPSLMLRPAQPRVLRCKRVGSA